MAYTLAIITIILYAIGGLITSLGMALYFVHEITREATLSVVHMEGDEPDSEPPPVVLFLYTASVVFLSAVIWPFFVNRAYLRAQSDESE